MTKAVRCVETGQVFASVTEAAESVFNSVQNLSAAARGKVKTCGGYHWEFVETEGQPAPTRVKPNKPRSAPSRTIEEVQEEARRRSELTGKRIRYAHIQIEETLALAKNQTTLHKPKRRAKR